ncbi:2-phospho-L-lactate guanylyltransferase [uncultured Serinicoccus sp.]|uniref:2-phospho-L-lactate guanylyltransferase n=1 Tax=uncultured Serinicoccus sp. TaxID=735514 RepID=UPI00260F1019|nr:2-phospho-L-lactate guanylyltransferase [uncultured Serinicoccus sp.]
MTPTPRVPPPATRWRLVVPLQRAERAKTRLVAPEGVGRVALARAIAADTLEAVCRALPPGDVVVVTSDPAGAARAAALGARVVEDPGGGLNAAIRAGLVVAAAPGGEVPGAERTGPHGLGVLLGDLPCLRPADLVAALEACARHPRAVVPDADGSGTVLLTAVDADLSPRFGAGSADRHAATAARLALDLPRLRRDVDTTADLGDAVRLGLGPRTSAALAAAAPPPPSA